MYNYDAIVTDVYDGDTVTVDIDLGLGVWLKKQKLRLYGINAPEVRGPEKSKGLESRDALRELILDKHVTIETLKDRKGKYGRYLATIYIIHSSTPICVNNWLVRHEYAEVARY